VAEEGQETILVCLPHIILIPVITDTQAHMCTGSEVQVGTGALIPVKVPHQTRSGIRLWPLESVFWFWVRSICISKLRYHWVSQG